MEETVYIVGADPGKVTGLCLVMVTDGGWRLLRRNDHAGGLMSLREEIRYVAEMYARNERDVCLAVESPFRAMGASTMDAVKRTAVLELVAEEEGWDLQSYAPATIRACVTGSGRSKDADVARVVRELIGAPAHPRKGEGLGQHQPAAIAAALTAAVTCYGAVLERRVA